MNNSPKQPQDNPSATEEQTPSIFYRWAPTFMRRNTHMNKSAQLGRTEAFSNYYAPIDTPNLRQLFSEPDRPLTLEIGFGMGHSLIEMALKAPERNFVGVEVHEPGLGLSAFNARENNLTNLKLIEGDALKLLDHLPENHIDTVQLFFPDPWQKRRHYKRRFVSPERMQLVIQKLKKGGVFHTATDWEHYAEWMLEVLNQMPTLENCAQDSGFHPRPSFRPLTKFEKRGINSGHGVWDLIYQKR